jgi:hypothetical protein
MGAERAEALHYAAPGQGRQSWGDADLARIPR